MADDKEGREDQADDADRRQRERDMAEARERAEEHEPPRDDSPFGEVEAELAELSFPATGTEVVAAVGDREIELPDGRHQVADLVPDADEETFDSPAEVRARVQRPTVAAAMKRIVEAADPLQNESLGRSQRDAYSRTLRELESIDADDDDEGIAVIADWIVERIRDKGKLPGSRDVRREAAKFCRKNGYSVRNDEWLGV